MEAKDRRTGAALGSGGAEMHGICSNEATGESMHEGDWEGNGAGSVIMSEA